jgi:hypothetical protein
MAKTTFSSGVIVTSAFLNGAQQIFFDGQELDWHYQPLGLNSLVATGPNGLDSRYITLGTDQPNIAPDGSYVSGFPISGSKVVSGVWNFGYPEGGPPNTKTNAPKSFTTNDKYNNPVGIPTPTVPQKFAGLSEEDLLTKLILSEQLTYLLSFLEIDNGYYYYEPNPTCNNYSIGTSSTVICGS